MRIQSPSRGNELDHVVVVMFENRSFDQWLGWLYEPGEDYPHVNTQLFNVQDEANRRPHVAKAPFNTPPALARPSMDGFMTDYISAWPPIHGKDGVAGSIPAGGLHTGADQRKRWLEPYRGMIDSPCFARDVLGGIWIEAYTSAG